MIGGKGYRFFPPCISVPRPINKLSLRTEVDLYLYSKVIMEGFKNVIFKASLMYPTYPQLISPINIIF